MAIRTNAAHPLVITTGVLLAALGWAAGAWGAPITFNTALPVARGEVVLREQFVALRATRDPTAADRDLRVLGGVSVLAYGVTGDLTLFGILPYLDKRLAFTAEGQRLSRGARDFGDLTVLGRYTVFHDDVPGRNFRVAPFLGLKMPTAPDRVSDTRGLLPPPLQPGSGSWDPLAGVIATYQTLDYEIDAAASYKHNTSANGFRFGDAATLDASLQYRLWPRPLRSGVPGFLYGVVEANLVYQDKNDVQGTNDPNTGGTTLLLTPGLQYVTKRWVLEGAVQLPVVQDVNGTMLKTTYGVTAGFRLNF